MTVKVVVPTLGESVLEATVSRWLKQEGDHVEAGEVLVELETDKVNVEVGAERAGVLSRIERKEGEDVKVGDTLAAIEEEEAGGAPPGEKAAEKKGEPGETDAPEPRESAGARPGPAQTPDGGAGEVVKEAGRAVEAEPKPAAEPAATPVARRMAAEMGIDLSLVAAADPGGRVTKEAVEQYLRRQETGRQAEQGAADGGEAPPAPAPAREPPAPPVAQAESRPAPVAGREEERVRMSRRRRTIAQRLVEAQQTAAILTTFNEVDMSAVMDLRKRRNESFQERYGVKLGFTSFFVKASIGALKAFPRLNAEIQGDEIVLKHYYDIGIAVGAEDGLVVPVIRDADRLSFAEIERKTAEFAQKAREGTLSIEDLRGGTFTITNGGVFGSLLSTPILNPPQVGILGLHKIEPRPVAVNDEVVIRPMMYVALSYDHRIVDGREAVQFLVRVKNLIEDPETLLLEG